VPWLKVKLYFAENSQLKSVCTLAVMYTEEWGTGIQLYDSTY